MEEMTLEIKTDEIKILRDKIESSFLKEICDFSYDITWSPEKYGFTNKQVEFIQWDENPELIQFSFWRINIDFPDSFLVDDLFRSTFETFWNDHLNYELQYESEYGSPYGLSFEQLFPLGIYVHEYGKIVLDFNQIEIFSKQYNFDFEDLKRIALYRAYGYRLVTFGGNAIRKLQYYDDVPGIPEYKELIAQLIAFHSLDDKGKKEFKRYQQVVANIAIKEGLFYNRFIALLYLDDKFQILRNDFSVLLRLILSEVNYFDLIYGGYFENINILSAKECFDKFKKNIIEEIKTNKKYY